MASTWPDLGTTLETIERRLFDYLLDKIGGEEGVDAFIGRFNRRLKVTDQQAPDDSEDRMWALRMSGDGDRTSVHVRADQAPNNCWAMGVQFIGLSTSRKFLQRMAGIILTATPASADTDDKLINVQSFRWTGMPTFEEIELDRETGREGGAIEAWRLEVQMDCVFNNVEQ